ncbi:hypothetical protein K8T06_05350 [bacterium]|nr:hypothetical protein [bacterium]
MNRLAVILVITIIALAGCTPEEVPAEPTPDLQTQMQTNIDMGNWLLNSRYIKEIITKASNTIELVFVESDENTRLNVSAIIEKYNENGGLISSIKTRQTAMQKEQTRLAAIPEKDVRIYANLEKCNALTQEFIELLSEIPETSEAFSDKKQHLEKQLDSIYKILKIGFPESNDEFAAATSQENLNYKADLKLVNNIPERQVVATPTPETTLPTPTPTLPPAQTWMDEKGVLHMGHHPPENANLQEIKNNLSGAVDTTVITTPETESESTSESIIWIDGNGVTHMGSEVPEGVEGKPAQDIPLMIGK